MVVLFPPEQLRVDVVKSRPNNRPADFAGVAFAASNLQACCYTSKFPSAATTDPSPDTKPPPSAGIYLKLEG